MRKKIVYIISDLDYALAFEWLVREIDRAIFDLHFILIQDHSRSSLLEEVLSKHEIPTVRLLVPQGKRSVFSIPRLCRILLKIKPTAVHCHMRRANILGLTAAFLMRIRHRIFTRHYSTQNHLYFPSAVKTDKLLNKMATTIVAPSETVRETLTHRENVSPKKVQVIFHGFDLNYFSNPDPSEVERIKTQFGLHRSGPVVGVISRFIELKGLQYIIPAFGKFLSQAPQATLLLANAHGPYEQEVNRLLDELPAGSWRKVGFEKNLSALYGCMDIFIHTPINANVEAFGQVYVEALAAGVPAIYSISGIANQFIVHETNALVVPHKEITPITDALIELNNDKALCRRLIAKGKASTQRFRLSKFVEETENLYA